MYSSGIDADAVAAVPVDGGDVNIGMDMFAGGDTVFTGAE